MSLSPPPLKRRRGAETCKPAVPPEEYLAIYSWNVNGIEPLLQTSIFSFFTRQKHERDAPVPQSTPLRSFLRNHSWPALCCLQEVKIRNNDVSTMRTVQRAVAYSKSTPDEPDYEAHFCLPADKTNARAFHGKLYGVCTIIRKDWAESHVERVREVEWDQEGRILIVETKADQDVPRLAIINVYLVNGTDHPYRDPESGVVSGTRHDRKLKVHRLLQEECRSLQERGFAVILAGDINVARTPLDGHPNLRTFPHRHSINRADFEARFFEKAVDAEESSKKARSAPRQSIESVPSSLAMIDTFRLLHPQKRGYTYYPRTAEFGTSCDRVDMIIASQTAALHCTEAGMHETPSERGPSDHVPLYACFAFAQDNSKVSTSDSVLRSAGQSSH